MGLFSNNKKLCPVCGNPTPRLLATKIEGEALCSECATKEGYIGDSKKKNLTLNQFQDFLSFYEADAPARSSFQEDYVKTFGGLFNAKAVACDYAHHLFKLNRINDAFTLSPDCFVRLVIKQDNDLVLELTKESLKIYDTHVIEKIEALKPEVDAYNSLHRIADSLKEMNDSREYYAARREGKEIDYNEKWEKDREYERSKPDFRYEMPFKNWHITVEIDHPWAEGFSDKGGQWFFDSQNPSVAKAIDSYQTTFAEYKELAMCLRKVCCPNNQIIDNTNQATPGTAPTAASSTASASAADELMKYKGLLDAGVITQAEFDAKKKQLLGL